MTGHNTTPGEKLRAIFLAVLMVGSAFAMGVAFTGSAAASVNSANLSDTAPQTVGDDITVTIDLSSPGESVTVENHVDGEVKNTIEATDGDDDSTIEVTVQAGKTYNGSSEVVVIDENGTETPLTYDTSNYDVQLEDDTVTQGETSTIEGTIYEYPGHVVDDHTVDYELVYDPNVSEQADDGNETVLASSDTGSGQFQTVRTFDAVDTGNFEYDYPTDGATVGSSAQPSYVVYVMENNTAADADSEHEGYAQIDTRLDVEGTVANQNGTAVDPTYGQTVDIVDGMVANADGGLGDYALRVEDPTGSTQKTTTSASGGQFGFTLELNDAGTWNLGTNEGAFIGYQDIVVDAQQADLQFSAEGDNLATFQETYNIQLNDSEDGFALKTIANTSGSTPSGESQVRGYINVTGPFEADGTLNAGSQGAIINSAPEEDGVVDYVHLKTDASGAATLNATPAQEAVVTATLELNESGDIYNGLEQPNDAADSPTEPDYVASEEIPLGGADPVNIIDAAVEEPQTANPSYTNETGFGGTYTDILTDNGPAVVEVLPLADSTGDRINNEERFGNDSFQDLDGMTVYRPSFELRNETNQAITPAHETDGHFNHMEVRGAEINATVYVNDTGDIVVDSRNGNVLDANYTDVDTDGRAEYALLIRPTATDEADEQITHEIHVQGEDPVTLPLNASGLEIEEFLIDGSETDEILGDQNVDLTSVVNAPYDDFAPVNNGLVRLTQSGHALDTETDARTSNVNDGEYTFENISLGPRGIDEDTDGLAEGVSQLTFTAYQYSDLNPQDNALEQQEVDRAAVRTVDLAADDTLQVEYLPEQTSTYSGYKDYGYGGTFTLTKGVEYEQIAFELTTADGEAVDLTEGIGGQDVALNDLAGAEFDGQPFVSIVGPDQEDDEVQHRVLFNETASDPANGTYVIEDITESYSYNSGTLSYITTSTYADTQAGLNADDSILFRDGGDLHTFQLQVTTPDASYETDEENQGYFNVDEPSIDTEVLGVNVNETTLETFGVAHTADDNFTSVDDVENLTVGIDRWYRVEGQVTDTLGNPINGTVLDGTVLQYVEDGALTDAPDRAEVYFLNTLDNTGETTSNYGDGNPNNNTASVTLQNESGHVVFDIKPTDPDGDGTFTPQWSLSAKDSATTFHDSEAKTYWHDGPTGQLPRVEVYDQSGAMLPVDDETGNMILANDVTQTLRVEAFPADDGDLPVPSLSFAVDTASDPVAETTINTDTNLITDTDTLVSDNPAPYPNVPYDVGQVGYLTVTPTGTGDGIVALRSGSAGGPITKTIDNENITFDVLRSNKQVNLELGSESVTPGGTLDVTVTRESNGEPINLASIALSDTNGNVIDSVTTNEDGVATIEVASDAELGTYTLETRPAGFEPMTQSFQVESDAQLDEELELYADDEQVISGTSTADAGTNVTIELNGPGLVQTVDATVQDDGTFAGEFDLSDLSAGDEVTATIDGDSQTYTVQEPQIATVDFRQQQSSTGDVVTVAEAYLPEGGFVVIHNADGDVIGSSDYIAPGTVEDVDVLLDTTLSAGDNQVTAMAHQDDNDNQTLDFPGADAPYTNADGDAVTDSATVRVPDSAVSTPTDTTTTTTTTTTDEPADTTTDAGDGDGPGFGIAVALVALLGAALLAVRRNN